MALACLAIAMVGCVPPSFDPAFNDAAHRPGDARQPIVGAWRGEWVSEDGNAGGPARLVVSAVGAGKDQLELEMAGFPTTEAGERFAAEASIDPQDPAVRDFAAKVPAVMTTGDLCAAALGLQAHVDGDAMRIDYWVNDALQQVDAGHVDLRRASPSPTTRP